MTYPEHIQWIIDNRTEALDQALSQDNSYKTIDNPLSVFLDADPTPKKKLTQWLVDTYINGGFRWEDIQSGSNSKAFDTLSLYVKHKSKLDSDNHIGQYHSLGSIYKDIAPFVKSNKSSRSVKRDEQAQAYEESDILVKSDSLTVVIPKTEYASKWWGKGTQWCTAGDKNNVFNRYYKNGPLIIIIVNGVKTQLFVNLINKDISVQFMDENDREVELNFIEDNWELLSPIIEWAVKNNGKALQYIPEHLVTKDLCLEAVRNNGAALEYVPELLITPDIFFVAVNKNGIVLSLIPEPLRTEELCLDAVMQDGRALAFVPGSLKTLELCLQAVSQDGMALAFVPESLKTVKLFLEAVRKSGGALRYVSEPLITVELCLDAVKQYGNTLYFIPESLITKELCLEAVRNDGLALVHVPRPLRTVELCPEAVRQNGEALIHVPESLITAELCLEAVRQNGNALDYVPTPLKTAELCLMAVIQNSWSLRFVPRYLRTLELCLEAVKKNGLALVHVPENLMTEDLCLEAVRQNGMAFNHVPELLRTAELLENCNNKDMEKKWGFNEIKELKLKLDSINLNIARINLY